MLQNLPQSLFEFHGKKLLEAEKKIPFSASHVA
jgi:hypothetical protein